MNHKRGRPKNRRAGCLTCKPWKMNGGKRSHIFRDKARLLREDAEARYMMLVDEIIHGPDGDTASKFMADWQLEEMERLYELLPEERR